MTKYSVSIWSAEKWESIALFADTVDFDAMVNFCVRQFENGNSLSTPAENIAITDLTTGEVVWDWVHDYQEEDDPYDVEWDDHYWDDGCPVDDVDESNYDPYMGCDYYESCDFDGGW